MGKIKSIHAREILDSRGTPTVEVDIELEGTTHSIFGRAAVPSGASTGEAEAIELRDGDNKRYLGKGVSKAVSNVNAEIAKAYTGRSVENQEAFDRELCKMDGTHNKARLGANAILGVSMAYARAEAKLQNKSLIDYIAGLAKTEGRTLPVPMMNIVNGGKHADNSLDIQEFMILPHGFTRFSDALRAGVEVFHALKKALKKKGLSTNVGDEGGFAPVFEGNGPHDQALQTIVGAIEAAGYEPGKQISLALDAAASEFLASPGKYNFEGKTVSVSEMIDYYEKIIGKYPIISLEDALAENDWEGWSQATKRLGGKCQFVGDDLFVTNKQFLQKGIELNVANSILIKLNQIGSVTETLDTINLAKKAKYTSVISHRSGETEDSFIADFAVGTEAGQIKTGSLSRTDRICKYNQLIRIEEVLGSKARFLGRSVISGA